MREDVIQISVTTQAQISASSAMVQIQTDVGGVFGKINLSIINISADFPLTQRVTQVRFHNHAIKTG